MATGATFSAWRRRLEWRGIGAEVTEVTVGQQADFTRFDLFFIGGGQDFERRCFCPT